MPTGTSFIALTLASAAALLWLVWRGLSSGDHPGSRRRQHLAVFLGFTLLLAAWLAILAALAQSGFFQNSASRPPRVALLFLPIPLTVAYLALSPRLPGLLSRFSGAWLLGLQVFRVPVELLLLRLHHERLIPRSMTFEGRNFDILIGLTAPVAAYLYRRAPGPGVRRLLVGWNVLGIVTVINVAVHGALSVPSPLRLLFEDHANTAVQRFPYVWLPGFLVPLALALHVLFLRQQSQVRDRGSCDRPDSTFPTL